MEMGAAVDMGAALALSGFGASEHGKAIYILSKGTQS